MAKGKPTVAPAQSCATGISVRAVQLQKTGAGFGETIRAADDRVDNRSIAAADAGDIDDRTRAIQSEFGGRRRTGTDDPTSHRRRRGVGEIQRVDGLVAIQRDGGIGREVERVKIRRIAIRGGQGRARPVRLIGPATGAIATNQPRPSEGCGGKIRRKKQGQE